MTDIPPTLPKILTPSESSEVPDTPSTTGSRSPRASARVLPKGFVAKTGTKVMDGVYLGRELGAGVQAKVFDLVREDGSNIGRVVKLGHTDVGHSLFLSKLASSMMDLQREWELGMQLKAALEQPDGTLPGFTRTCDCMVVMHDERKGTASFQGLVMERINGWPISKRICDPAFCNIHYVREMLFQVFSALDRGQRALGFNHSDLGLNNVMEHYPSLFPEQDEDLREKNAEALTSADQTRFAPACQRGAGGDGMASRGSRWRRQSTGTGCTAPPHIAGYTVDSDGGLASLGPHIEFKIIDYGVAEFNEVLAQAAGGDEPEEIIRDIHAAFEERGIPLGAEGKKKMIDLVTPADGSIPVSGGGGGKKKKRCHKWALRPFGTLKNQRFVAVPMLTGNQQKKKGGDASSMTRDSSTLRAASGPRGPIEAMYRNFWSRKGDVYHLLLALGVALDDRVWPKEDERDVQSFASLVHHVTGIKIKAYFASPKDPKRIRVMGKKEKEPSVGDGEGMYGARVRCFAVLRRWRLMLKAHLKPFNSGLLAGEALVAPFFGNKGPPHAALPVCVEAAFPVHSVDVQ